MYKNYLYKYYYIFISNAYIQAENIKLLFLYKQKVFNLISIILLQALFQKFIYS